MGDLPAPCVLLVLIAKMRGENAIRCRTPSREKACWLQPSLLLRKGVGFTHSSIKQHV